MSETVNTRELRLCLSRRRGMKVHDRTFRYWKFRLGINALPGNEYLVEDAEALKALASALKAGWTIDRFIEHLKHRNQHGSQQSNGTNEEPIEVTASAVA